MIKSESVEIKVNPAISNEQLFSFYQRNSICEEGFGKEVACIPLKHSALIVGAFFNDSLVGIARATFDGLAANIMEFCLELELQGENLKYTNGSLLQKDTYGIGKKMGKKLLDELFNMGAIFISYDIVENCEESFYMSIGLARKHNHVVYYIDKRCYKDDQKYQTKPNF